MKVESNGDDLDPGFQNPGFQNPESEEIEDGLSLEELSQSYKKVLHSEPELLTFPDAASGFDESHGNLASDAAEEEDKAHCPLTPMSIVESVLFVGRPDSAGISASELASLMRGVQAAEIAELVQQLNSTYEQSGHAFRIFEGVDGYRFGLAEDLEFVRDKFYGRVREIKLNQAAIDCLALVSYQPGITKASLEKQRSQPSSGILNQLLRRQLIEIRREGEGKSAVAHYYPTERLLKLAGLGSLEDLPQVEEFD